MASVTEANVTTYRKIMAMPRTNSHADKPNQKSLGFFLQCNADSDSAYVYKFLNNQNTKRGKVVW